MITVQIGDPVYRLNMIDTPGHVDFSYEVSRSLAATEGALLVVDATQGVEAQSVANCYMAAEQGLEIIPVLNKMDVATAEPERVIGEIQDIIGIDCSEVQRISARTGDGVRQLLEQLVARVPPPAGAVTENLQALIIDSWFDNYLGVTALVRVKQGRLQQNQRLQVKSTKHSVIAERLGIFRPESQRVKQLEAGEVGFVVLGIKDVRAVPVGDTLIDFYRSDTPLLPGLKCVEPRVYASMFPVADTSSDAFRQAVDRLALNDAAFFFEPEHSDALGPGLRCGFLGLLHMEIVQERLEREYGISLMATSPTVAYEVHCTNGEVVRVANPSKLPPVKEIVSLREPIVRASILTPREVLGDVIALCMQRRGEQRQLHYSGGQVMLEFDLPMSEVVGDFFDRLKSVSSGYASLDYSLHSYVEAPLVRLDILVNGDAVDALATIVHRSRAEEFGRSLVARLTELIPRQMFEVAVQAAIGKKIIARKTLRALRKNVTAKCYGGDVTRKRKLLEKQKAGKKRMKRVGQVDVPQEAFMAVLSAGDQTPSRRR